MSLDTSLGVPSDSQNSANLLNTLQEQLATKPNLEQITPEESMEIYVEGCREDVNCHVTCVSLRSSKSTTSSVTKSIDTNCIRKFIIKSTATAREGI